MATQVAEHHPGVWCLEEAPAWVSEPPSSRCICTDWYWTHPFIYFTLMSFIGNAIEQQALAFCISFGSYPFVTKNRKMSLGECNLFVLKPRRRVNGKGSGSDTVSEQSFNEDMYVGSIMKA